MTSVYYYLFNNYHLLFYYYCIFYPAERCTIIRVLITGNKTRCEVYRKIMSQSSEDTKHQDGGDVTQQHTMWRQPLSLTKNAVRTSNQVEISPMNDVHKKVF